MPHQNSHINQDLFLKFKDLNALVHLHGCSSLVTLIRDVLPGWEFEVCTTFADHDICARITPSSGHKYLVETFDDTAKPTEWNALNAVCELIGQLAWEQLRSMPHRLCLHAAAVQIGDRLIIIPNSRRAGKSTLCAHLAHKGLTIFSDDFVRLHVDSNGTLCGWGNGVLPRVRLPLPETTSEDVKAWQAENDGPANSQYQYLNIENLAPRHVAKPVGAIVVLDRDENNVQPELFPIAPSEAMDHLLYQNFARSVHSGVTLTALKELIDAVPVLKFSYAEAASGADFLIEELSKMALPVATLSDASAERAQEASFDKSAEPIEVFETTLAYGHSKGVVRITSENEDYLSDADGLAVHRLNAGSAAIWQFLSIPATFDEVVEGLSAAFPDVDPKQIEKDCHGTMTALSAARLIQKDVGQFGEVS